MPQPVPAPAEHERERPMRRNPMDLIYLLGMFGPVIVLLVILLAH
ncbi:hypothetical protein ACFYNO_33035 [Kitasatospora sp. NPDC006697]